GSVGENWKTCSIYPAKNISENQKEMFINISELLPDTCYWIEIMAHTRLGYGTPVNNNINTSEA
ncbi:hypothetical protein ACJMK2_028276, partial [Sinanodonta woodiana]